MSWVWICLLPIIPLGAFHLQTPECLTHHHDTPHSTASDQGTHVTAREVQPFTRACGINWTYHIPEVAGLIERWNGY